MLLISSCNKKTLSKSELVTSIIKDSLEYKGNYKSIIVFQEKGCVNCQYKLFDFIKENKNNNDYLFIIQSNEQLIDLSPIKKRNSNIIFDHKKYLYNYNVTNGSTAILFNNSKIDTILKLDDPYNLNDNLKLIKDKI